MGELAKPATYNFPLHWGSRNDMDELQILEGSITMKEISFTITIAIPMHRNRQPYVIMYNNVF